MKKFNENGTVGLDIYKILKNPTRRKIIEIAMRNKEICNSTLAKLLNVTRSSITYHLKILENIGIIKLVREEDCGRGIKKKYYKLNDEYFNKYAKEESAIPLLFEIYKRLKEKFTDQELYKIGFDIGYEIYAKKVQSSELDKILEEISRIFNKEGVGVSEVINNKFRMYNCYSCSIIESATKLPRTSCIIEKGFIAGVLSKKLNKEVVIHTVKCRKVGDNYCEFEVL